MERDLLADPKGYQRRQRDKYGMQFYFLQTQKKISLFSFLFSYTSVNNNLSLIIESILTFLSNRETRRKARELLQKAKYFDAWNFSSDEEEDDAETQTAVHDIKESAAAGLSFSILPFFSNCVQQLGGGFHFPLTTLILFFHTFIPSRVLCSTEFEHV
jgi:hypothetical protein